MIKILIVDDHALVRVALRQILGDIPGMSVIGEANDGSTAINFCQELKPDVVLMDIQMPGMNGFDATLQLRELYPDIKILVVTAYENDVYITRLLQIGAAGCILKSASKDEMIRAIQIVSTGQRYLNSKIASQLVLKRIDNDHASPMDVLSNRELDVARCISEGMDASEIADKLQVSPKTVNSHRYRIFEKLKIKNDVELARLSVRHGLVEIEPLPLQPVKSISQPLISGT